MENKQSSSKSPYPHNYRFAPPTGNLRTRYFGSRWFPLVVICAALAWTFLGDGHDLLAQPENQREPDTFYKAIVSNGHADQAAGLGRYLKEISGAEIPILPENPVEDSPAIILDISDSIPGTSNTPQGSQGYRIHTEGSRLYLTGRSQLGLTYAVYGLLEDHFGVRFYSGPSDVSFVVSGEGFEVVPKHKSLKLQDLDDTQEPAFAFRGFIWNTQGKQHEVKNRGRGFPDAMSAHNFYHYIPPDKYFNEHPEWFPEKEGKRTKDHLHQGLFMPFCYTNESLAAELADQVMETMATWKDSSIPLPVGQGDGFIGCDCASCRAVAQQEESEAGPMILMLNRVLEKTTVRFPDHKIITFAYFDTLRPTKTIRPHDNLWINITSSAINQGEAGDQLGRIRGNPRNADYAEAIRGWPKIAPGRVVVWDWATHFFQPLMEWPNLLDVADNLRFYAENGIDVVKLQICLGNGNWGHLRRWLWLKMMWDPEQDEAQLTQQYLTDNYGQRAGAILWEYLKYVHRVVNESGYRASVCRGPAFTFNHGGLLFDQENLARMDEMITAAEQAASRESEPGFANRMARVRPMTIDVFAFPSEKEVKLAAVKDPRDGLMWLVPDGQPDMPARIERVASAFDGVSGGGGWCWFYRYLFQKSYGGPLVRLENEHLVCELVPNRDSQITSLIHRPTGEELVVISGYDDAVDGNVAQEWTVSEAEQKHVKLNAHLQFHSWEQYETIHLERTLRLEDNTPRLTIQNVFRTLEGPKRIPPALRFLSCWTLRIPQPQDTSIRITRGGLTDQLSIDDLATKNFDLEQSDRKFLFQLDRGDGLVIELSAPGKGFDKLMLELDEEKKVMKLRLSGIPHSVDQEPTEIKLPSVMLEVIDQRQSR